MITHGGISEIVYYKNLKKLGLSEEYFFALPYECQRAILMAGLESDKKRKDAFQKRMALKQYEFEEKAKEKVLRLIKKNK